MEAPEGGKRSGPGAAGICAEGCASTPEHGVERRSLSTKERGEGSTGRMSVSRETIGIRGWMLSWMIGK